MKQEASKQRCTVESITSTNPNLYLQIIRHVGDGDGDGDCLWYKLDLEHEKALLLNWQSTYKDDSIVAVLKSEIYILGGVIKNPWPDPDVYLDDVHRINTAMVTSNESRFESAPPMLSKRSRRRHGPAVVMGDKIIFFNYDGSGYTGHTMEIFDRSSDQWFGFSAEDVHFPCELEGSDAFSMASDPKNNRILMQFEKGKGLYAFYLDSFRWESLNIGKYFDFSIVVNAALYFLNAIYDEMKCTFVKYELVAFDLADGDKPLKIVWPSGFDHQFFRKSIWMDVVDLGNGKLCLVSEFHEHLDVPSDYDSDEYYYSEYEFMEEEEDYREKKKYMPVIICLVLELEKQPPPPQPKSRRRRRKTKLLVTTVSRLYFKLEDLIFTCVGPNGVIVQNALVVPR